MVNFGLWNPRILHQRQNSDDDYDHENQQRRQFQPPSSISAAAASAPPDRRQPNGYGTVGEIEANGGVLKKVQHSPYDSDDVGEENEKTVLWKDEVNGIGGGKGGLISSTMATTYYDDQQDVGVEKTFSGDISTTDTTSVTSRGSSSNGNSSEQSLPSLTAAFVSIENRSIIINCMFYLLIYMTIAVIAYSFVFEKWTIIDSLYFAVATFTTCGYGDLEPTTTQGKLFTIVFAIYGVMILGVFIAIFGSFISEAQTRAMKRFQRKQQHQMIETLFRGMSERPIEETGFWRDHVSLADDIWRVLRDESPLILLVAMMAFILGVREGWDWASTLYFCIMAATTTGYGDYTPKTQIDKLYCVILLPLAVAVFGEILGRIATVYIQRKQRISQTKFLHRSLTLCDIRNMDSDDDGRVDLADFMSFMLIALQKVDRQTIEELKTIFQDLDRNGNGLLEEKDLEEIAQENYLPTLERIREELDGSTEDLDRLLLQKLDPFPTQQTVEKPHRHRRVHTIL